MTVLDNSQVIHAEQHLSVLITLFQDIIKAVARISSFFKHESCGTCFMESAVCIKERRCRTMYAVQRGLHVDVQHPSEIYHRSKTLSRFCPEASLVGNASIGEIDMLDEISRQVNREMRF